MIGDLAIRLLQAVVVAQASTASLPPEKTPAVTCLAQNLWFEARGSSVDDQVAIANVVMNRVADSRYPDEVCDVVWQSKQFSWTHDGRSDRIRFANGRDREIWKTIVHVSIAAVAGEIEDTTGGATHYHADYVQPGWANHMRKLMQIDDHIYYRTHGRRVATPS